MLGDMTLVLALRCHEGVVIGSDGQATTDASGQPTRQPVRKLFALGRRIAWGAAGSVGLRQQLERALAQRRSEVLDAPDPRPLLTEVAIAVQRRALRSFVALPGTHPPDLSCLFCWWDRGAGAASILTVPATGADHQLHERWAAIGSGDLFAGYAMGAAAHLRLETQPIAVAKLVAYQALADAITTAAVLLGPPIQMALVTPARGAVVLDPRELEHELPAALDGWRARQREALVRAA
jgi:ATP-dependent protease HslVU (ClpYQ) peptidase subunit